MGDGACPDSWVIALHHADYPNVTFDLSDLAEGSCSKPRPHNWGGEFSGRPELLRDLWSSLVSYFSGIRPKHGNQLVASLRAFYRYLDAREKHLEENDIPFQKVIHLHHVSGLVLDSWLHPGPNGAWKSANRSAAVMIRLIVENAIDDNDLGEIHTSPIPEPRPQPKDTPSDEEGLSLIRHIRSLTAQIFRRWDQADELAARGRNLLAFLEANDGTAQSTFGTTTEADAHATYRAFVAESQIPLPNVNRFLERIGASRLERVPWWPRRNDRIVGWDEVCAGFYPTSEDVCVIALLCIARTAWNPSTLFSIDIRNWHAPYDDSHAWIYAPKARAGGAIQHAVSEISAPTSAFALINRLIARSSPLRDWVERDPAIHRTPGIAARSPFLAASLAPGAELFVCEPHTEPTLNNWLKAVIRSHNDQQGSLQVRSMSPSDFRDISAAVMYRDSRYSMWVMQLLLGHKNQSSTIRYGYRHASRRESGQIVSRMMEDVLDQSRVSGRIDHALTRARIDSIPITPDSLVRLESYRAQRTYAGAFCNSPTDPPADIDPRHPRDGRSWCAQGHLCVAKACPRATVLKDSLDRICRSVAELEWRRNRTSSVRWSSSSAESDLERLMETLKQWPNGEVSARLDRWRASIDRGEHKPLFFGGTHSPDG